MANLDNVDFRQTSPNIDTIESRPLSVYDNLNAGNIATTINTSTPIKREQQLPATTHTNPFPEVSSSKYNSDNEYPFSDISFKFDDLPIKSVTRSNSLNNNTINNNNKNNHNIHNHNHNNNNNNNDNNGGGSNGSNSAYNFQLKKSNSISNAFDDGSGGIGPLTSIEGRPITAIAAATANATTTTRTPLHAINKPHENNLDRTRATGAGTISHHDNHNDSDDNSYRPKPVMSDAKSTFFGLNKTYDGNGAHSNNNQKSTAMTTATAKLSKLNSNSCGDADAGCESGESEPLISQTVVGGEYRNGSDDGASTAMAIIDNDANQSDSDNIIRSNSYILGAGDSANDFRCNTIPSLVLHQKCDPLRFSATETDLNGHLLSKGKDIETNSSGSSCSGHRKQFTSSENGNDKKNHNLSQAVYMTTTVPQNIKGTNIMGSHTPTRSSLRHSRMLVINKNYQVPRRRNSLNIKHPIWAKIILSFHILVGLAVSCLGLWLCWWAPSTRSRDNPYWSGLILILSGILGFVLFGFKRIPRHKLREHLFKFFYLNSTLVTVVAGLCTLAASLFAAYHITYIITYGHQCAPAIMLQASSACICNYSNVNTTNQSRLQAQSESDLTIAAHEFYYRDLNCNEVTGAFKYILISSSILNFIGFLICTTFISLLCVKNSVKRKSYTHVRNT